MVSDAAATWAAVRRGAVRALPREHRDSFDAAVLDLLSAPATPNDGRTRAPSRRSLEIGAEIAKRLARYAPDDPESLAAAAALPVFDRVGGGRDELERRSGPPSWPVTMVLAMTEAPGSPVLDPLADDARSRYLRQLAALPPLLRAAVLAERQLTGLNASGFDRSELDLLADGVPRTLLPQPGAARAAQPTPSQPVGSAAEAVDLVKRIYRPKFGSYLVSIDPDAAYEVTARETFYAVRVPAGSVHYHGSPVVDPGSQGPVSFGDPGWIVDRATRAVRAVNSPLTVVDGYIEARRVYPLPPGWRPGVRPPVADGLAFDLTTLLPPPARPALGPLLGEITARYTTTLVGGSWPDHLAAWRVARHSVWTLAAAGETDPTVLGAALLVARGMATTDALVDAASGLWLTPAGTLARAASSADDERHGPGLTQRVGRLVGAPVAVRAVTIADARARASVETELFGVTPRARRDELVGLWALAADLPALHAAFGA